MMPLRTSNSSNKRSMRPSCLSGHHVPEYKLWADADGIQHSRCRHCGCELRRLPAIRRWYRSGPMG